jgi:nitrous oxidase accessory protein
MIRAALLFILSIYSILLCGKQIEVCPECPIKSINESVRQAQPGDEIIILKGVYVENDIEIDKPLTITGIDYPVIDGTGAGHIIKVLADSVHISGLKLINVGQSYTKDYAAIYLSRVNQFEIHDMILEKVFFGMLIEKSHYGKIYNNRISGEAEDEAGAGNGIHLWHCSNAEIFGNEIFEVRDGIYFEFVTESIIRDNYSHDNIRYGLHFMFSNNDEYHYNTFVNNGAGVAVMFSKFITMTNNKFFKNWGTASYGLLLKEIYDAEIENNIFEENTIGINLEGSTRINYIGNNFIRNGWAIKIAGACYTNIFDGNNFLHNSFDVSYNSKLNDNLFENNYWSAYTGYDLDKDGVGDVPFRPVNLFSYVVNKTPETIVLLRSLFVDIINFSEKVSPVFTPDNLMDAYPLMQPVS